MIAQDLISELYFSVPFTVVVMFSTVVHSRLVSPDLITELYFSLPHQRQARSSNALGLVLPDIDPSSLTITVMRMVMMLMLMMMILMMVIIVMKYTKVSKKQIEKFR